MTLYRIDEELAEMLARDEGPSLGAIIRRGIQVGVLVPVEVDQTDLVVTISTTMMPTVNTALIAVVVENVLTMLGIREETP